jgi:molybdate transport system ATP-binding protein
MNDRHDVEIALRVRRGDFSLDVELRAPAGVLVVVGPNGAGKSTLLRAVLGAQVLERGYVALGGARLEESAAAFRLPTEQRRLAYLPQGYGLFPHLSVAANLRFALGCAAPGSSAHQRERQLTQAVQRFSIEPLLDRAPRSLSGGEMQRVALARALATLPRALLLDEPLSALDPVARGETRAYLAQALRELALPALVVTHDRADALALADRVVVLEGGRVTQSGDVQAGSARPCPLFGEGARQCDAGDPCKTGPPTFGASA